MGSSLCIFGANNQGLESFLSAGVDKFTELFNRVHTGGGQFGHFFGGGQGSFAGRQGVGFFYIGGVITLAGKDDGIFPGLCQYMKFMGDAAADAAGVRQYRAIDQAGAIENRRVGLVHQVIGLLQRCAVYMKGVGVLHAELPGTHDTKAWSALIAKLGLDLIEISR